MAGFQGGLGNFMTVIKIRSPGSSDNDKGNQALCCSLWDDGWGHGKELCPPCCPERAGRGLTGGFHLPLKRRVLPTGAARALSLISSGATVPCLSVKIKHETLL